MQSIVDLERSILENLRQLPSEKQQEVLDFTEFLKQKTVAESIVPGLTLQQIAAMSITERHKILAASIESTAHDFRTDPALTEFSVLDAEDWEPDCV
jgi:hypothetical protein